jgi:hypothetical protein
MRLIAYSFLIFSAFNLLPETAFGQNTGGANARTASTVYQGGYTQAARNNASYAWGGPTTSTVTATMNVAKNASNEDVVVMETYDEPYRTTSWQSSTQTFAMETRARWHKNGGHTGTNADNPNSYVGWVKLSFSNPVPASEIFIRLYDMDNRGVDSEVPDGYIRFTGSEAEPADFEQLVMTPAVPSDATSSTYNTSDGSIAFGIGAANANRNKYLGLVGKNEKTVSQINIFIRNVGDDVGIEVGWINPKANALPVTLIDFDAAAKPEGTLLTWHTSEEKDFDRFEIEQSSIPQAGFTTIGTVYGGGSAYSFTDAVARNGASYYRLKMIDTDGTFTYSRIVHATTRNGESLYRVYPNPLVGPSFYIGTAAPIGSHKVHDIAGRPVNVSATNLGGKYEFTFGRDAQPGIYIIAYKSGGKLFSQKFVLNF